MAGMPPGAAGCFPTSTSWCRRRAGRGRGGPDAARLGRHHHDAYDQRYYREWMHELPPMQHLRRGNVIDVHHAILPETAAARPDPAKLRAAAVPIATPSPARRRCSCWRRATWCCTAPCTCSSKASSTMACANLFDIHRLLQQFGRQDGFWDGLPARARELELARPLFYALRYCQRLLGTPVPDAVTRDIAAAGPGRPLLALMDRLFLRALAPAHPSCGGCPSRRRARHVVCPRQLAAHAVLPAAAPFIP
jgi:hypothetical protein